MGESTSVDWPKPSVSPKSQIDSRTSKPAIQEKAISVENKNEAPYKNAGTLDQTQITPSLVRELEKQWKEQRKTFIEQNDEIWANGCNQDQGHPFDKELLSNSSGTYEGTLTYEIRELSLSGSYRIVLSIGSGESKAKWKMELFPTLPEQSGSFSSAGTGTPCSVGTDGPREMLSFAIDNSMSNESAYASHFGFKVPANMSIGESVSSSLFGLTEELVWKPIGSVLLRRM